MTNQEEHSTLIEKLQSSDRLERLSAASQVAELEGKARAAIPILKSWIGGEDKYSHVTAIGTIIWIDKSEANTLIPLLIDALEFDCLEQWEAILWIQSLGELALPAVPVLERLVDGEDTTVCWQASDALYQITGHDRSVLKVGHRLLNDPDELIRVVAVEHLMQLGKSVIPTLEKVSVEDESDLVRNRALAAMHYISSDKT